MLTQNGNKEEIRGMENRRCFRKIKNRRCFIGFLITCLLLAVLAVTGSDFNSLFNCCETPQLCYRVYPNEDISSSEIISRAGTHKTVISISAVKVIESGEETKLLCADLYGNSGAISLSGRADFSDEEISEKQRVVSVPSYCESAIDSSVQLFDNAFTVIGRNSSQNYYRIPLTTFEDVSKGSDYYVFRFNGRLKGVSKILSGLSLQMIVGNHKAELFLGDEGVFVPRLLLFLFIAGLPFLFFFLSSKKILDFDTCKAGLLVLLFLSVVAAAGYSVIKVAKEVDAAIKYSRANSCYKRLDPNGTYYMTDWSLTLGNKVDHDDLYAFLKREITNTYEVRSFDINEYGLKIMLLDDSLIDAFLNIDADTYFSPSGTDENGSVEVIAFGRGISENEVKGITVKNISKFHCLPALNANTSNLSILEIVSFDKSWLVGRRTDQTLETLSKTQKQKFDTNFLLVCDKDLTVSENSSITQKGALWSIREAAKREQNRICGSLLSTFCISVLSSLCIFSCFLVYKELLAHDEKTKEKNPWQ